MTKTKKVILEQQAINRKLWAKENGRMHHVDANKLIAEFMGANPFRESVNEDVLSYEMYGVIDCIEDGENEKHFYHPDEMEFQSDWNWLMPVVAKCYEIGELGSEHRQAIEESLIGIIDIESTTEAVLEFIKEYNEQS